MVSPSNHEVVGWIERLHAYASSPGLPKAEPGDPVFVGWTGCPGSAQGAAPGMTTGQVVTPLRCLPFRPILCSPLPMTTSRNR